MKRFILTVMLSILAASIRGETQIKPAVKTNVLYDAFLNVNLGVEIKVARRWSLDLSGDYNGWKISGNRQWKHWLIQPEARYWTKEAMNGHFFAAHLLGGQFNTAFSSTRRQGWGVGAGVGYGYSRRLGSNWGLEAEIAAGYLRYGYDKYPCAQCGRKTGSRNRNYVGPTKAAVNLVYYFGQSKKEKPVAEVAGHQITPDETTNKPAPPPDSLPKPDPVIADAPRPTVITESVSGTARIHFAVNETAINLDIENNSSELGAIVSKLDSISNDCGTRIVQVELIGYASPEGGHANNDWLASRRTAALKEAIQRECGVPDSVVIARHVAEDWDGLRKAVLASNLEDKNNLLDIIDSDKNADQKEAAMKRHKTSWAWISSKILPRLRRTEYVIRYERRYEPKHPPTRPSETKTTKTITP